MRFYVSPESIFPEKNIIEIKDKTEIHYIRDVLRLRKDTDVDIFDGRGREYSGHIKEIDRGSIIIEIGKIIDFKKDVPYKVTLYQAVPKKSKIDFIIEKAVELGVDVIVPLVTERTVAKVIKEKGHRKLERWQRIVKAASRQCGRTTLPAISHVSDFNNALTEAKRNDIVIFAALDKHAITLKEVLKDLRPRTIAVFVGPEGDFSQDEISMARGQGFKVCSLGPLVLRLETAAIYILSCLNYEYSQ